jgi:hypothetical protein
MHSLTLEYVPAHFLKSKKVREIVPAVWKGANGCTSYAHISDAVKGPIGSKVSQ